MELTKNDVGAQLNEDTTTPHEPNIATTDENLSVDAMFQQSALQSLGRQIFSVLPMEGPTAALFNIRKKTGTNDFELVRNEVEVFPPESISTGFTQEVMQDVRAQYGKDAEKIVGKLLRGIANDQENARTLEFLNANSLDGADLQLTDSLNSFSNASEIFQVVNDKIIQMNSLNTRTYESFCVLPVAVAGSIMARTNTDRDNSYGANGLFIGQYGLTKYYVNPDPLSTKAYVGLKDSENPSKSSAAFSPYISNVVDAVNPETGEMSYHIFNRFAITASPLHVTGNEMLHMFDILV